MVDGSKSGIKNVDPILEQMLLSDGEACDIEIQDVIFVPSMSNKLLSVPQI